ncbi:hypothetical protein [Salinigranum salinum]|uniref:hypothetical protein n=1 Tax=Salinigranum salinum TaxID=1364937 RepID=UPI001260CF38|nr:hypothetical protein [Salinigranum salinum]
MTNPTDRNEVLAASFERIAAALRTGDATLYGYDVSTEPQLRERGGISHEGGWLSFELVRSSEADD